MMTGFLSRFRGDPAFWLLLLALAAGIVALVAPRIDRQRHTRDVVMVVDITGSMNVRDTTLDGAPASRLESAKRAMRALLADLPCRSRAGLAIFTERRAFLLLEPAEVCENFAALDAEIAALDWRMAWEGDSYIARGAQASWTLAQSLNADLVFLSDGHEAPPLPSDSLPPFERTEPAIRGLIVGVGGLDPAPIPKFDDEGREIGFYSETDVPQENRFGPPPADAEQRPGYNPRNAPFGGEAATGTEHLSAVHEEHLHAIADQLGLSYFHLAGPESLGPAVLASTTRRPATVPVDTYGWPAGLALLALVLVYTLLPALARRRDRRPTPLRSPSPRPYG
ncbi:VWA domain-containing protein [Ancylobacter sp. 6x-1]|uniref:VWA domain-containing protein n=1 Tax=Ancylobacter crimeensis TaxID=2579147 RepID=A0ABT0DDA8_9HYPH|nr:vWA domain-containing protein [Ancylobacter crimeensis]MCK0197950.1 VWA domain-containing protein [Ancylobacter crimeensis]